MSQKARDYCCKDGDVSEYGTFPESSQGIRSVLETFFSCATKFYDEHGCSPAPSYIASEYPAIFTKFTGVINCLQLWFPVNELVPDLVEL